VLVDGLGTGFSTAADAAVVSAAAAAVGMGEFGAMDAA
jgi:hypothetical protein